MSRAAPVPLVLAAHGVRDTANEPIERLARRLAARGVAPIVATAYHAGSPPFDAVLDRLRADRVVVVPLFTSDGYYTRVVLPRRLARNRIAGRTRVHVTPPVGRARRVAGLVARHLERAAAPVLREHDAVVVVAGHGTRRLPASAGATLALGRALARRLRRRVRAAFLDHDPALEPVVAALRGVPLVVFPFLLGGGPHALADLPRRVRRARGAGVRARLHVAAPFGELPELPDLVAAMYRRARRMGLP